MINEAIPCYCLTGWWGKNGVGKVPMHNITFHTKLEVTHQCNTLGFTPDAIVNSPNRVAAQTCNLQLKWLYF